MATLFGSRRIDRSDESRLARGLSARIVCRKPAQLVRRASEQTLSPNKRLLTVVSQIIPENQSIVVAAFARAFRLDPLAYRACGAKPGGLAGGKRLGTPSASSPSVAVTSQNSIRSLSIAARRFVASDMRLCRAHDCGQSSHEAGRFCRLEAMMTSRLPFAHPRSIKKNERRALV
jgi:hypothetical protein